MVIANFLLFQLAWFACVVGAAHSMPWLGVAVTLVVLMWHLYSAKQPKSELLLIFSVLIIGACFDQAMVVSTWVDYQYHGWSERIVPVWILALWVAFATTLNVSLAWMQNRYYIALIFGAIGGPLAYLGAERLGAVSLNVPSAYVALSIGWAMITPAVMYMAKHLNGYKS